MANKIKKTKKTQQSKKNRKVQTPHDLYVRHMLTHHKVRDEFLKRYLPDYIKKQINFDKIREEPNMLISSSLEKTETDVIFSIEFKNKQPGYVLCHIEHQSTFKKDMPLRMLGYFVSIWYKHLKDKPEMPLPVIVPIILYNGKTSWHPPMGLLDMFHENSRDLLLEILASHFNIIDVSKLPIKLQKMVDFFVSILKLVRKYDIIETLDVVKDRLPGLLTEDFKIFVTNVTYILDGAPGDRKKAYQWIEKYLTKELGGVIMTVGEQLRKEGIEQGFRQGIEQTKKEAALKMLDEHLAVETIQKVLGLTLEEINKLETESRH